MQDLVQESTKTCSSKIKKVFIYLRELGPKCRQRTGLELERNAHRVLFLDC